MCSIECFDLILDDLRYHLNADHHLSSSVSQNICQFGWCLSLTFYKQHSFFNEMSMSSRSNNSLWWGEDCVVSHNIVVDKNTRLRVKMQPAPTCQSCRAFNKLFLSVKYLTLQKYLSCIETISPLHPSQWETNP